MNHFVPSKNVIYKCFCFHIRRQGDEESAEEFITDLHSRIQNCDFPPDYIDRAIMNKIFVGIPDKNLFEKIAA